MGTFIKKDKYCVIKDKSTGELICAMKVSGKIETIQNITFYDHLKDIPVEDVLILSEGEFPMQDFLYNIDGKVKLGKNIL